MMMCQCVLNPVKRFLMALTLLPGPAGVLSWLVTQAYKDDVQKMTQ